MTFPAANVAVVRGMGGAKPQPPQTFKPADFLARVRAELVMQPLSSTSNAQAGGEQVASSTSVSELCNRVFTPYLQGLPYARVPIKITYGHKTK
jgi:hypothetical protein